MAGFIMDFKAVIDTVSYLKGLLKCSNCERGVCELFTLGDCEDILCRDCCDTFAGKPCPLCGVCCHVKDAMVNCQLSMLTSLCSDFLALLTTEGHCENDNAGHCEGKADDEDMIDSYRVKDMLAPVIIKNCRSEPSIVHIDTKIQQQNTQNQKMRTKSNNIGNYKVNAFHLRKRKWKIEKVVNKFCNEGKKKSGGLTGFKGDQLCRYKSAVFDNSQVGEINVTNNIKSPDLIQLKTQGRLINTKSTEDYSNSKRRQVITASVLGASPMSPVSTKFQSSSSQAMVTKRNAKGETALHVAAIKGNKTLVEKLLHEGANPNVQDHAGWTVLHEACNHGHVDIATQLLEHGAVVNIAGSGNDSPLHDAVANGHVACAKLLRMWGASLTARNTEGLTPMDYAVTDEMRSALTTATERMNPLNEQVENFVSNLNGIVILGTSLNRQQRGQLQRCAKILNASLTEIYTPQVTHVVTSCNPSGQCPRTLKYLQAVLAGKWIVTFDWVVTCVESTAHADEKLYEVMGTSTNPNTQAPFRARSNRMLQLPGLFHGCSFYFRGPFSYPTPNIDDLKALVMMAGGTVLAKEPKSSRLYREPMSIPYHASANGKLVECGVYVVYDTHIQNKIAHRFMYTITANWLMDCMASFTILDPPP